jgi:hypothetical protein
MNLTAVLYGLFGFLAGFLAGTVWNNVRAPKVAPPVKKTAPRAPVPLQKRRWNREQWIGPVVLLLAILMGVQYMWQVNRQRDITECQSQFNQAFAKQLTIRSELASQAQANVDQIILSIGTLVNPTDKTPSAAEQKKAAAEYRKLFTDFAKESATIADKRKNTPLPQLPREGCGSEDPVTMPVQLALEQARVQDLEARLDAQRASILKSEVKPVRVETAAAPVRTVVVRETSSTRTPAVIRTEPDKSPTVVVNVPKVDPVTPAVVVQPVAPVAEPACTLNLLGICVDL